MKTYNWARDTPQAFRTGLSRSTLRTNGTSLSLGTFQSRLSLLRTFKKKKNQKHVAQKSVECCSFVCYFVHD